jgi:hypothetical protein
MTASRVWCEHPLRAAERPFCSTPCRRAFEAGLRAYVRHALASGLLAVAELKEWAQDNTRVAPEWPSRPGGHPAPRVTGVNHADPLGRSASITRAPFLLSPI